MLQDVDFEAQGLVEHKEYLFRVAAANANGTGDWLEMPSSIVAKMPFGKLHQESVKTLQLSSKHTLPMYFI